LPLKRPDQGQKLCQRQIKEQAAGGVALESAFGGFGEASAISLMTFMTEPSKTLSSPARTWKESTMTTALHGWELVSYHWKHFWNKVIDWFINNL
jgi:hypothetical protein